MRARLTYALFFCFVFLCLDVCLPCMRRRIENEEKAQLCYSKAKIYIKVHNDEEAEYLSNEEVGRSQCGGFTSTTTTF